MLRERMKFVRKYMTAVTDLFRDIYPISPFDRRFHIEVDLVISEHQQSLPSFMLNGMLHAIACSILLHYCFFFLSLLPAARGIPPGLNGLSGGDDQVQPPKRISNEDRLFCPNPLPKWRYGRQRPYPKVSSRAAFDAFNINYPPNWSYLNFTSLTDLCSARGRFRTNYGGKVR